MFSKWLAVNSKTAPSASLDVEFFELAGGVDAEDFVSQVGHEVSRNYLNPGQLIELFGDLDLPTVGAMLRESVYPKSIAVRHGDFGEIMAGAMLRHRMRWCVPVLKLRYKQRPDQAVQGTDVLAFRLRVDPPIVMVPEVKTRTTRKLDIGIEANQSLEAVLARLPQSIWFVCCRLYEQGNPIAKRIAALMARTDYGVQRQIFLIHDSERWSDEIINRLAAEVTIPTQMTVMRFDDLKDLIVDVFAAAETEPVRRAGLGAVRA